MTNIVGSDRPAPVDELNVQLRSLEDLKPYMGKYVRLIKPDGSDGFSPFYPTALEKLIYSRPKWIPEIIMNSLPFLKGKPIGVLVSHRWTGLAGLFSKVDTIGESSSMMAVMFNSTGHTRG